MKLTTTPHLEVKLPRNVSLDAKAMAEACLAAWGNLVALAPYPRARLSKRLTAGVVTYNPEGEYPDGNGRYPNVHRTRHDRKNWLMEVDSPDRLAAAFLRMERQAKKAGREITSRYVGVYLRPAEYGERR